MEQYRILFQFITTLLMIWKKMLHLFWGFLFLYLQKCTLCGRLCGERRTVNGTEGQDVILRVEHNGIMGNITWLLARNHFATTGLGGFIEIRDKRYKGKVFATADGSLNITGLTRGDRGAYTASTLRHATTKSQLCAHYYDLRVYAGSNGSSIERVVSPQLSSTGGKSASDYTLMNFIRLLLAACIFVALCCFLVQHWRRSRDCSATLPPLRIQPVPDLDFDGTDEAHPTTIYVLAQ